MKKVGIILGTRPEIIKLSPIIRMLNKKNSFLIHTGQHYSYTMDKIFFNELKLRNPEIKINLPHFKNQGEQTAEMIKRIEKIFLKKRCSGVIIQGDTNSGLAGALASVKLNIPIIHIEAGMRSNNKNMPEEINRILIDHISDVLFVPSKIQEQILRNEGIEKNIFCVGDITYNSIKDNLRLSNKTSQILKKNNVRKKEYYLLTLHRKENVDNKERIKKILNQLKYIKKIIIFPIHPRTKRCLQKYNLLIKMNKNLKLINPVGYYDMLQLEKNAIKIITDSGGIQKESYFLGVPCITLRKETEWIETLNENRNILVGINKSSFINAVDLNVNILQKKINLQPKKKIISILTKLNFI